MEFAATREALASLYEETPVATLLCEPHEMRIVSANRAAQTLLGRTVDELTGAAWALLCADADRLVEVLCLAASGEQSSLDLEIRGGDGVPMRVACDAFPARIGERLAGAFVQVRSGEHPLLDALTGLPSSAVFEDRLEQTLMTARRYSYRFAVIAADVDAFTTITQRHGGSAGDWVLRVVSQRVREALRRSDSVVRSEKDRFFILQPVIENVDDAVDLAHKIVFAMHAPISIEGRSLDVRLSLGVAVFPIDGEERDALVRAATDAMRSAKSSARGLFRLATNSSLEPAT
ncbi:MAG: diguanylate cyclase domain-containing protein [Candidatus Tyrphobacter sp.]